MPHKEKAAPGCNPGGLSDQLLRTLVDSPSLQATQAVRTGLSRAQGGTAVYRHGQLLGFLIEGRRHGFDAVTASGAALGKFNSMHAAAAALVSDQEAEHVS